MEWKSGIADECDRFEIERIVIISAFLAITNRKLNQSFFWLGDYAENKKDIKKKIKYLLKGEGNGIVLICCGRDNRVKVRFGELKNNDKKK